MSWLFQKLLDKQGSVPKSRQGFRVGPLVILLKFLTHRRERNPFKSELLSEKEEWVCMFFKEFCSLISATLSFFCFNLDLIFPSLSFTLDVVHIFPFFWHKFLHLLREHDSTQHLGERAKGGHARARWRSWHNLCLSVCDVRPGPSDCSTRQRLSHYHAAGDDTIPHPHRSSQSKEKTTYSQDWYKWKTWFK